MAMIIYKNLFPKDFNDLQVRQGYVYSIFNAKPGLIDDKRNKLNDKIERDKEDIQKAKKEHLQFKEELDYIDRGYNSGHLRIQNFNLNKWNQEEYPRRKSSLEKGLESEVACLEKEIEELNMSFQN